MSIRHIARSSVLASFVPAARRLRKSLAAALLLVAMGATVAAPAAPAGDADAMATLTPLNAVQPDTGAIATSAGQDVTLSVAEKIGDQPVAGRKVKWEVTGPGTADVSPKSSTTSAPGSNGDPGVASTVFHAAGPGDYVVTATTQKNPGCTTPGCASWVSTRFDLKVGAGTPTGSSSSSGGLSKGEMIGAAVAGAAALALAANNSGNDQHIVAVNQTIVLAGGNNQSAPANSPLAQPLKVQVKNNGSDAASIGLVWSASGGAVLSNTLGLSDANGFAQVQVLSVGPGPGPITITATRSDDMSASVSFTANVIQPGLNIVSGDGQSAFAGQRIPEPLVVEAVLGTAPQANVPISWSADNGATVTSVSNGGVTAANGRSQAVITLGPSAGPVDVTATRTDIGLSQTFHLNATITNTLTISGGNLQTGAPNRFLPQALKVTATTNNRPATGVTINWSATGGATLSAATSVTGGLGDATIRVTNMGSTLGPVFVTATRADDPTASVQFTENIIQPTLQPISGGGQSGLIGTPASAPLEVQLLDGAGKPMVGQNVTWTVIGSDASVPSSSTTAARGIAKVNFTYGSFPVQFTIQASFGSSVVSFTETSTTATGLTKISGDGQVLPANANGKPLVVQIQAAAGSGTLQGVPVTFTMVPNTAGTTIAIQGASTVTDATGKAQSGVITMGPRPGQVQVLAQVAGGGPSQVFTETISGTLVTPSLSIVSGNFQVITPNSPSQNLVVQLKAQGSPLAGQTINWSTTSGTLSASAPTDSSGETHVTITPTTNGPIQVTASFGPIAQYNAASVTFSENTTLGTIPSLTSNAESVGAALDSACAQLQSISNRTPQQQDLLNQCLALNASSSVSAAAAANAINQLTPTVAETQSQTAVTATTAQFDNLSARMNALRSGAHGVSFAGLAFDNENGSLSLGDVGSALLGASDTSKKSDDASFSRWGLFASGQIGRQDASAQDGTPGYSLASNGITTGVDYRVNDSFVLGGAIGYARQITDLDAAAGHLTMNGWSLSGYATWYQKNDWYMDGSITWGDDTFDSQRLIDYSLPLPGGGMTTVDQIAQASSAGNDWAGSLEIGRDFHHKSLAYGFYGKLQYDHQAFDAYQEQIDSSGPGSGLGLRVDSRTTTSVDSVLGAKFDWTNSANWGVWIPHVEAEWQHEFRTNPGTFTAFFLDDPTNTPIEITGDQTDSDFFRLGVGMSFVLPQGRSAFVLYDRTIGRQGITQYNLSLGFRIEF